MQWQTVQEAKIKDGAKETVGVSEFSSTLQSMYSLAPSALKFQNA
jgi:hypothetical protein